MKILVVGLNAKFIHSSMAVYSLAASCRVRGQQAEVAEYTINQELLFILRDIMSRHPDLVGFSCYIWNIELVLKLVALLYVVNPGLIVVLGGPEVSFSAGDVLRENAGVDFVVQGEGEESLPELVQAIQAGEAYPRVPGIARRSEGGTVDVGEQRVVETLDNLPFPYGEEDLRQLQNRIVYFESSRGCPFSCSYCLSAQTRGVRYRSVEKVEKELDILLKAGVRQIKFVDRTFNVRPEHYRPIWRLLATRRETTNCHFEIVADRLEAEDFTLLEQLPAGRVQFEIGIQTLHPEALTAIGRRHDWAVLESNVRRLREMGTIHLHLDLIAGLPCESYSNFQASFNVVFSMRPDMLQLGFLKMLPGSLIRSEIEKHEYRYMAHPPYEILSNRYLTFEEVVCLKQIEEVLNQTYNSGRFSAVLTYLVDLWSGNAFQFYDEFARWFSKEGMFGASHGAEAVLEAIRQFAEARIPEEEQYWLSELLKFDVLMDPTGALQGRQLDWNGERWHTEKNRFWRDEACVRRYVPDYHFTSWRDVKRRCPVEVFSRDVVRWLSDKECTIGQVALLFIRDTGRAPRWIALSANDLPLETG